MLVKMMEVLVKIAVMMMASDGVPAPLEARGREPPFFFFFLDRLPRWEKGSPLVLGSHDVGGARATPRLDLSLCLSLFLHSQILPFHRFFYIRRSVTPIGLKPSPRFFLDISFLSAKEDQQPPYGVPTRVRGAPPASWPPRASSRVGSSSQKS